MTEGDRSRIDDSGETRDETLERPEAMTTPSPHAVLPEAPGLGWGSPDILFCGGGAWRREPGGGAGAGGGGRGEGGDGNHGNACRQLTGRAPGADMDQNIYNGAIIKCDSTSNVGSG